MIPFTGMISFCLSVLNQEMQNNSTGRAFCSQRRPNKCFFSRLEKKDGVIGVPLTYLKKKMKVSHLLLLAEVLNLTAMLTKT